MGGGGIFKGVLNTYKTLVTAQSIQNYFLRAGRGRWGYRYKKDKKYLFSLYV